MKQVGKKQYTKQYLKIEHVETSSWQKTPGRGSILPMGNNPSLRKRSEEMLTRLDLRVILASNGQEAFEKYRDTLKEDVTIDLALLD